MAVFMLAGCQTQLSEPNAPAEEKTLPVATIEDIEVVEVADTMTIVDGVSELPQEQTLNPDLWSLLRENLALDHELDRRSVQQEIRWFQRNPKYCIAKICNISPTQINIKGKTTEKLGVIGKEKAIACEVIASVIKND